MSADFKILIGVCDVPGFGSRLAGNSKFALLHSENTDGPNFLSYATKAMISMS